MEYRLLPRWIFAARALAVAGLFALFVMSGCDSLPSFLTGLVSTTPSASSDSGGTMQLHLKNLTGLPIVVEADYSIDGAGVRHTVRLLTANGPETQSDVQPTTAKLVHVHATIGAGVNPPVTSQPTAAPKTGDVVLDVDLVWLVDFQDGERVELFIRLPIQGVGDFIDCNHNGISDADDLASGRSTDCNCNGIPDECDLADGTLHDVFPLDGIADECHNCPTVDLVFVMDTSGSIDAEARQICTNINSIAQELQSIILGLRVTMLGIDETPGNSYFCLTDSVSHLLGPDVPNATPCCTQVSTNEDWAPAVSVVAARFSWTPGALRMIVPISDEGPSQGDPCEDPGPDRDAITTAIGNAQAAHAIVSPILAHGALDCTRNLATELAHATGGTVFDTSNATTGLPDGIRTAVLAACSGAATCP